MLTTLFYLACSTNSAAPAVETPAPPAETPAPAAEAAGHAEPAAPAAGATHFGAAFSVPDENIIAAPAFFAATAGHVGKTVRVEGRVADVCQKAGCWMVIAEGEQTMRVRMKDHAFSVAKDGTGATACIEGTVVEIQVDPATAEHFASEGTPGAPLPEKAATAGKVYEIEATAVEFKRS